MITKNYIAALNHKNNFRGFSIVEIIVVIFIIALISLAAATFQNDIFSLNRSVSDSIGAQDEMRGVFKQMTAEIRSASSSSLGAYPISDLSQNSFTFYSDIDADGLKERIRYFLSSNMLKKGVLKPSGSPIVYNLADEKITEVVHDVANGSTAVFSYYDKNYDGSTSPLSYPIDVVAVRLIKINIIIDRDINNSPGPVTFTTQVSIRNLKDNL